MAKFGVGQAVRRVEDVRLLTGHGRFTDDVNLEGQTYLALVRSPHAHAEVNSIDVAAAREAPGVLGVFTAQDLDAAGLRDIPCLAPMKNRQGERAATPGHPILARGRVRHVGDPVAAVVAETPAAAREAAELVEVDYESLPHVVDTRAASDPESPRIWPDAPNNVCLRFDQGDAEATDRAFAEAVHTFRIELVNNRVVPNAMEPRGAIGAHDADSGRYTLHVSSQGSHGVRDTLAEKIFGLPSERFHVITPDVGGGFGSKIFTYAEYALVLFAAERVGRPVKWIEERGEAFQSDVQGRDQVATMELAFDADHRITGLRYTGLSNMGAYLSNFAPAIPTTQTLKMLSGVYRIPAIYADVTLVFTNTVPVDAYRGAGRPEAAYFVERAVDAAARELRVDPAELRRKNFIRKQDMPYATAMDITYDSGDFERLMDTALANADIDGFLERRDAARREGKLLGLGIAYYIEACAGMGEEDARLRVAPDGSVDLHVGTKTNGQGHATAYAQILADKLGVTPEQVRLHQGDSDDLPRGAGTDGSRSLLMGGGATGAAADAVVEKGRKLAGFLLEAAAADIEFAEGVFTVAGTDKRLSLAEVAAQADRDDLPDELKGGLEEAGHFDEPPMTYPNGCHVCEIAVDEATGVPSIQRYTVVDDFGKVVNPLLVAGQVHGGVAQGLGQALWEHTVYEADSGQLVTASYMDYTMPRADGVPPVSLELVEVPCATNPMGIKGAGEAGAIGATPAAMNALADALTPYGHPNIDMPATSEAIWRAMHGAGRQAAA